MPSGKKKKGHKMASINASTVVAASFLATPVEATISSIMSAFVILFYTLLFYISLSLLLGLQIYEFLAAYGNIFRFFLHFTVNTSFRSV